MQTLLGINSRPWQFYYQAGPLGKRPTGNAPPSQAQGNQATQQQQQNMQQQQSTTCPITIPRHCQSDVLKGHIYNLIGSRTADLLTEMTKEVAEYVR